MMMVTEGVHDMDEDMKDSSEDRMNEIEPNDEEGGGLKWTRMTLRMMTRGW